jgi:Uma2 family endonuclease
MLRESPKHLFTVEQYDEMGRTGILPPDWRTELIEGEIYDMSPIGDPHAAAVKFLNAFLHRIAGENYTVSVQDPVQLGDYSAPQPDLALLEKRADFYRSGKPTPADIYLAIEVADSSQEIDRRKMSVYAKHGVREAWLVNIGAEQVELNADPIEGKYRITQIFRRGEIVRSRSVEAVEIAVDDIFG